MKYLYRKSYLLLFIFFFCFSLVITRWYRVPLENANYEPRGGVYGDVWSSLNVYSAARHFKDYGFRKTAGLPVFGYNGNFDEHWTYAYTHYPPLPDELAGMYAIITDSKDVKVLSLFPIGLSVFFFFFIYYALQVLSDNKPTAFFAATVTVMSCYFICWADDLHQHVYAEFSKWIFVLLLYLYYNREQHKKIILFVLCLLYLINSWLTYEDIVYFAIAVVGFSIIYKKKIFTIENFILLFIPVLGFGLHAYQNYCYFGSWDTVIKDLKGAFIMRTTGTPNAEQGVMHWKQWTEFPSKIEFRFKRMFLVTYYSFIFLAVLGFLNLYKTNKKLFWVNITLLLCSISWIFTMPQHAYIHLFTIRQFGLFYASILCAGFYAYWLILKQHWDQRKIIPISFHAIFIVYTIINTISSHVYYVYLKFGYGFPLLGIDSNTSY